MGAPAYTVGLGGPLEICANVPCCVACCAVCEMRKDVIILKMNNAVCRWAKRFRLKNHTFWSEL